MPIVLVIHTAGRLISYVIFLRDGAGVVDHVRYVQFKFFLTTANFRWSCPSSINYLQQCPSAID